MPTDTDLSDIASALGLPSGADCAAILTEINSQITPDPAKYVPIEAVRDLMNDRGSKVAMARESDVEAMVSDALDSGFITPGMRDWAMALCRQDPDSFVQFTESAAPAYAHLLKPTVGGSPAIAPKSPTYDEAELAICAQLNIEPVNLDASKDGAFCRLI